MPKRPGRDRGIEYDRFGRPLIGITTTEEVAEQVAIPTEVEEEEEDGEA